MIVGMTNTTRHSHLAPMTPIIVTRTAGRLSATRPGTRVSNREIWEARSICGTWTYERGEEPGTPWIVIHVPTGYVEYFTSLPRARRWTASDGAMGQMVRVLTISSLNQGPVLFADGAYIGVEAVTQIQRRLTALTALAALTA